MNSYKDLIVWQKAMELVVEIYKLTESFPKEELYGLTSQIRRSVISIPSNIAEGSRRVSRKDFRNFLMIAYGSGAELETQIEIAKKLAFTRMSEFTAVDNLLCEVMKILNKMTHNLN
ncbi:hypothetical protein A3B87_01970 [Candidatus Kuenenbacteria bacterium RIFCSPHIGHO2_02_FULL_39_13]|uniref:Four helix bundle protein n=1 Tax=Candidatus Kuenenbacteria bacterium RIFCSPHIGHO2_02_FULL_39_13 TaxID=1798561 RepID=A0A1F6FL46_9BACT|nr:MAG: hypothetical protein A3B87_01970 [Candidatus Kuenenbacteria bacterium RIFCSPHIGHO2_02_FULL_39_13]